MRYAPGIAAVSLLLITSCASSHSTSSDPLKEEVIILQKQLLELQLLQNETKASLDESKAALNALSAKIQSLEERPAVTAQPRSAELRTTVPAPDAKTRVSKKKTQKKTKKKSRRQE